MILYEAQGGVRQIFMDGRSLPNNDPDPWWYGYSIGHWDGDTLVVETTGFRDDVWLDVEGSPLTNTGKMTERFRRVNFGHLEMEITIEDPKAYTHPWTVKMKQRVLLDYGADRVHLQRKRKIRRSSGGQRPINSPGSHD